MKSILLIGLGRFGRHIAEELNKLGHEVMAVDEKRGARQRSTEHCDQRPDRRQHQRGISGGVGRPQF